MTLAAIAAELGLSESAVRRALERALEKLLAGAGEIEADPIFFSTAIVTFLGGSKGGSRRISPNACEGETMPRVSLPSSTELSPGGERRCAGPLPRRFKP